MKIFAKIQKCIIPDDIAVNYKNSSLHKQRAIPGGKRGYYIVFTLSQMIYILDKRVTKHPWIIKCISFQFVDYMVAYL